MKKDWYDAGVLSPGAGMRRREFIQLLSSTAAAWPHPAQAQQGTKRVTVVLGFAEADQEGQARLAAFVQTLARLGWNDGRNMRLAVRWAGGDIERYKSIAR